MKLTVDAKDFVESVAWVTKNYDAKDAKAYVALIVDSEGKCILSHSNSTSFMKSELPVVSVNFDGDSVDRTELALDGKYLQRLSGALNAGSGNITFSKKLESKGKVASTEYDDLEDVTHEETIGQSTPLDVKTSYGRFTVPLFDAKLPAEPKMIELGEVLESEYFDSLQRLAKLTDTINNSSLPSLGCVDLRIDLEDDSISMMATDRYSLGEITLKFSPSADAEEVLEDIENILLPYESAMTVSAGKNTSDSVKIVYEKESEKFGYSLTDGRIALFSLTHAAHTEYKPLLTEANEDVEHRVVVPTNDLKKAVGIVSSLAWEETSIWLEIDNDGKVTVTDAHRTNTLSVDSEEPSDIDESYRVSFNRTTINNAFSPISTAKMQLGWIDENHQFCLYSILDDGSVADNVIVLAQPEPA